MGDARRRRENDLVDLGDLDDGVEEEQRIEDAVV